MTIEELKAAVADFEALSDAAWSLSAAAWGKYEDRHKFKWDLPEIEALKRLRAALRKIGRLKFDEHEYIK